MNKTQFYIRSSLIALATLMLGVMAGFFWTYTFNVNLAMQQVDGETYATVQSLFNQNVRHSYFFTLFFGSAAVTVLAILANLKHYRRSFFWLLVAAAAIYIGGVIIYTSSVNLPLNAYTESWDISNLPSDWQATRDAWNSANALRVGTSGAAFILGMGALFGRAIVRD